MSGPKVINIEARRRQLQRECQSGLRELKDAVADWRGCLERAGKLTATAEEQAGALLRRLSEFPEAQDWGTLRDELHSHAQFFRTEAGLVRNEMVRRTKSLRERRRRVEISAAMLARHLRDMGEEPPTEVEWAIEAAGSAGEEQLARLENAVQATFGRLAQARSGSEAARVSERQRVIAERFKLEGARPLSLSEWVHAQSGLGGQTRDKDNRLTALLAEVEAWDEAEAIAAFLDRAKVISVEAQPDRRELLTDSLILDLSEFRNARYRAEELISRVRKALAMLEPFQSEAANAFRARLEGTLASNRADSAQEIAAAAESWCAEEAKREDAQLRRDALLKALGELGYEVREGMATAWATEGRIVVSTPGETNYGVELMSPGHTTAIQTRVVAFERADRGSEGTPRDKEVEEAWCSDFEQLRGLMSDAGFETVLRQAMPAGAVKLKVVPGDRMKARTSGGHGERGQART
jgi:hypothetical protein